jgi:hypothetical protein
MDLAVRCSWGVAALLVATVGFVPAGRPAAAQTPTWGTARVLVLETAIGGSTRFTEVDPASGRLIDTGDAVTGPFLRGSDFGGPIPPSASRDGSVRAGGCSISRRGDRAAVALPCPGFLVGETLVSPDGSWLAASVVDAERGRCTANVTALRTDGTVVRRLSEAEAHERVLAWDPDGSGIYVLRYVADGTGPTLLRVDLDGRVSVLTDHVGYPPALWYPFGGCPLVWGEITRVADGAFFVGTNRGTIDRVAIDGSGRRTVYTRDPAGRNILRFDVSPDGRWLAMLEDVDPPGPVANTRLVLAPTDGSAAPRILHEDWPYGSAEIALGVVWTTGTNVLPPLDVAPGDPSGPGYWMLEATGNLWPFGSAVQLSPRLLALVVSMAATPDGGYVVLDATGAVHTRRSAHHGNLDASQLRPGERPTTIAATPSGDGYWIFTDRGRVFPFGAARSFGDLASVPLNGPVIASVATPSGQGYYLVASDGGVFAFGDAAFHGSTGALRLNEPVVGIAPDPDGAGYWLVAEDGGIFAFDAPFRGSVPALLAPGQRLNEPVIGAIAYGDGYLEVASDGGIFAFSNLPFLGSLGDAPPPSAIVAVAVRR